MTCLVRSAPVHVAALALALCLAGPRLAAAQDDAAGPAAFDLPARWRAQPATLPEAAPDDDAWGDSSGLGMRPSAGATWAAGAAAADSMWLEQRVAVPPAWQGRRLVLDFLRIEGDAVVFANGRRAAELLRPGGEVDLGPAEALGGSLDLRIFITRSYAGISRGLDRDHLRRIARVDNPSPVPRSQWRFGVTGPVRAIPRPRPAAITDVWMRTSWRAKEVAAEVEVSSEEPRKGARLAVRVRDAAGAEVRLLQAVVDLPAGVSRHRLAAAWTDPIPWELDGGHLYQALPELVLDDGRADRPRPVRFGFREVWTEGRELLLNGRPMRLRMGVLGLIGLRGESLPFYRAMGSNAAYLQANPSMWWRTWAESPLLDAGLLDAADAAGFALFAPAPGICDLREHLLTEPGTAAAYEAEMRAWHRRWRNHPSILAWTVGMNSYNPRDAIAPQGMGRRYAGDRAQAAMVRAIERACAISRASDPTRLAYSHADGNCGDIASTNTYLNLAPLQERMEWPSAWAARGDMPYHAAEFGQPYTANYWKGRRFLLSEYLAIYLGDQAYARESEAGLRAIEALSLANTGGHGAFDKVDTGQWPAYWDFLAHFARWTDRSWRTFGVNGGVAYWEFDYGDPPGYDRLRASQGGGAVFSRYALATGVQPGQRPAWANPSFDIRGADNRPLLAWIAGSPQHTDRTHLYTAGEAIAKQVALVWDGPGRADIRARWSLEDATGASIAAGDLACDLEAGGIRLIPIACTAPAVAGRTACALRLTGTLGGVPFPEDRLPITVFPAFGAARVPQVLLYDPIGRTAAWLAELGVETAPWTPGTALGDRLLVVGREALRAGEPLPWSAAAVEAGARVLVCEQRPEVWRALGFRLTAAMPRQAFARLPTPVMDGLEDGDLALWRGAPDLLPAGVTPSGDVPYAPKWTNRHAIASLALRIPRAVGFRAHLACEFDLDSTPLLEQRCGRGAVWYSTLDLCDRVGADPAATRLAANLLQAATAGPQAGRTVRYRGGKAGAALLAQVGTAADPADAAPGDLLIVGAGATDADAADAQRHAAAGGRVLLLGLPAGELARFGMAATGGELVRTEPAAHPLAAGIPRSWLRWRSPLRTDLLQPAAGVETWWGGLAAWRATAGTGGIAALQAVPALLDGLPAERAASAQTSRAHLHQLVAAMITNLGARCDRRVAERLAVCDLGPGWEPIPSWHVLGPFPVAQEDGEAMLARAGAVGEASAIAGDTNPNILFDDGAGARLDWRRILRADAQGRLDLGGALQRETLAVAYLTTEVASATTRTGILRLGADWRLRAWVNGTEVFRTLNGGNRRAAHAVEIPLRQGTNVITLKVASGSKGFAVFADLDRPRPAGARELSEELRGIGIYAGAGEVDEFDPYEYHYW